MQTFIPYGVNFYGNANALDMRRNGKQRVEGLQILRTLSGKTKGWANHPAVKMWAGHEEALALYTMAQCEHWISRGYKDTVFGKVKDMYPDVANLRNELDRPLYPKTVVEVIEALDKVIPAFLVDPSVIVSHRSNLLRKDPEFYLKWGWNVPDDLPYIWPV